MRTRKIGKPVAYAYSLTQLPTELAKGFVSSAPGSISDGEIYKVGFIYRVIFLVGWDGSF